MGMGQHSGWTLVGESQSRQFKMASCIVSLKIYSALLARSAWLIYLETARDGCQGDVVVEELAKHGGHHGVATVHVADILMDDN